MLNLCENCNHTHMYAHMMTVFFNCLPCFSVHPLAHWTENGGCFECSYSIYLLFPQILLHSLLHTVQNLFFFFMDFSALPIIFTGGVYTTSFIYILSISVKVFQRRRTNKRGKCRRRRKGGVSAFVTQNNLHSLSK